MNIPNETGDQKQAKRIRDQLVKYKAELAPGRTQDNAQVIQNGKDNGVFSYRLDQCFK